MAVTLSTFNLGKALRGASIGWAVNGRPEEGLYKVAEGFVKVSDNVYSYYVEGEEYRCNAKGLHFEKFEFADEKTLFMVNSEIEETRGTEASRGDAESKETISIDVLQPREQFAIAAMQSIIGTMIDPMNMDAYKIQSVAKKSFEIAQAMMQQAAEVRAATVVNPDEEVKEEITVDSSTITSVTDKILYNLNVNLSNLNALLKDKELKIQVKNESVPVKITEASQNVPVTVQKVEGVPGVAVVGGITGSVEVTNTVDVNVVTPDTTT